MCLCIKFLKLPLGFSSNLSKLVTIQPLELSGLKSHDYHVIMEQLLSLLLRDAFKNDKALKISIQRISLFFKILCAKEINKEELQLVIKALAEAICILEKEFTPSFSIISVRSMIHIVDEALACGPVRFRWKCPFEW